jgi:hypothetical protein
MQRREKRLFGKRFLQRTLEFCMRSAQVGVKCTHVLNKCGLYNNSSNRNPIKYDVLPLAKGIQIRSMKFVLQYVNNFVTAPRVKIGDKRYLVPSEKVCKLYYS